MASQNGSQSKLSNATAAKLSRLTPEQLDRALLVAAAMLKRRDEREATGQTDLTRPFDPNVRAKR